MHTTDILLRIAQVIEDRKQRAQSDDAAQQSGLLARASYVVRLLAQGDDAVLKKIGEEATEVVMAAKDVRHGTDPSRLVSELADLWFHCLVVLCLFDLTPTDVLTELERRLNR